MVQDPTLDDEERDRPIVSSLRRIGRVAILAAECGARYARSQVEGDAAAWLHAPRMLFGGRSAIEAGQSRAGFIRGMILHSLELGFDATPTEIDRLIEEEPERVASSSASVEVAADDGCEGTGMRLFSATVADVEDEGSHLIFHASVAPSRAAYELRLRLRLGARLAGAARIVDGLDPSDPVAVLLLSDAIEDTLRMAADNPASLINSWIDVRLEQFFRG